MKKRLVAAMLLTMTLALAGCDNSQTGGVAPSSSAGEVTQSSAVTDQNSTVEEKDTKGGETKESLPAESSETDGMVSAGSKDDMGIDDSWKGIYADFLEKDLDSLIGTYDESWRDEWNFGLIYVNDDPTPELVASSGYEAAGNIICTPIQGEVAFLQTARLSFFYKEFGGVLDNSEGNMGYYYDLVYRLSDQGFELIHEGNNYVEYDEEGKVSETHFDMDGVDVTEEDYNKTIEDILPAKQRTFWVHGCSYADMLKYLKGDTTENYKEAYRQVVKDGAGERMNHFALIERTNYDPLLLCADDERFCFYAFEDGLLLKGPVSYFSETIFRLVYPGTGLIESIQYYENNEMDDACYQMRAGSLLSNYADSVAKYDENWDVLLDAEGYPIVNYKINQVVVPKNEFTAYISRNDEQFKQQLVSPGEDYSFIEYFTAEQMLEKLGD